MGRGGIRTYHKNKYPVTRRDEIFLILVDFARDHKGNSPTQRGLWKHVQKVRKQSMAYGTFMAHLNRLVDEGRLQRVDGELVVPDSEWIIPPSLSSST